MANKNTAGSFIVRNKEHINRLIDKIDRRSKTGEDRENVDYVWQKHTINDNGERCWSF